ncbi:MAG TPA: hypothetical protein VHX61_12810 [Rhizomicrobium sp.]|jgi:hypothetical protein|nr:hypothetical protein [Rhizomicrobium sp.]
MLFRTPRLPTLMLGAAFVATGATWAQAQAQDARQAPAKSLTIILDGTLGPVISGSDPAGLDGDSATVTVTASEKLKPYKTTGKSASYHIPAGDVTVDVDGTDYMSTSRSSMTVKLGSKADLLTFKASLEIDGFKVSVSDISSLQTGSWSKSVLQHPALFSPSPQNLTEPSSSFTYTVFGEATVLGVTGTASNSDAAD